MTEQYTFWKLLKSYQIVIPILQRDYAQGRTDQKTEVIRTSFIDTIAENLEKNTPMGLDFIYGKVDESEKTFIPLDGQQRLTTLYLLHWYFAVKEEADHTVFNTLSKFSYQTRESARRFCCELSEFKPKIDSDIVLSSLIKSQTWYSALWDEDATVSGMLVMLDEIHNRFKNISVRFFNRLIESDAISFLFLNMDSNEFKQTDSLYIKMNARGKTLTDFEIFKARFEDYLASVCPERKEEFCKKVDGVWLDLFWKKYQEKTDDAFLTYIQYIAKIAFYFYETDIPQSIPYVEFMKKAYSNKSSVNFLFDSLNKLCSIGSFDSYFTSLFSTEGYEAGKIALFCNSDSLNLIGLCIDKKDFGLKEEILLYTVLYMIVKDKWNDCTLRSIRNLAWNSDNALRVDAMHGLLKQITAYINNADKLSDCTAFNTRQLADEIKKTSFIRDNPSLKEYIYKLEDNSLFMGHLNSLQYTKETLVSNYEIIEKYLGKEVTKDKKDYNAKLFGRAMLYFGEYAQWISGNKYLFANSFNTLRRLMRGADQEESTPKPFTSLINILRNNSIDSLIEIAIKKTSPSKYTYYFIKYPKMNCQPSGLFDWKNDYELAMLTKERLSGWWVNPYMYTVFYNLPKKIQQLIDESCLRNHGWQEDLQPLVINSCRIFCYEKGWKIELTDDSVCQKDYELLCSKWNIKDGQLVVDENTDRIELCCNVIADIAKWK
jgi:hypothetical protein